MMALLNSISFERLLWLVPIFLTIHNIEEAPFMEGWYRRLPMKLPFTITTRQFVIAVTFITLAGFTLTYIGVEYLANRTGYLLVLGMQAILLFNAFVPHIVATIRFRMYSPGVISAILITLPFSLYLFRRALEEKIMHWAQFWVLLGIAPFAMVIIAFLSLQIGKAFDGKVCLIAVADYTFSFHIVNGSSNPFTFAVKGLSSRVHIFGKKLQHFRIIIDLF